MLLCVCGGGLAITQLEYCTCQCVSDKTSRVLSQSSVSRWIQLYLLPESNYQRTVQIGLARRLLGVRRNPCRFGVFSEGSFFVPIFIKKVSLRKRLSTIEILFNWIEMQTIRFRNGMYENHGSGFGWVVNVETTVWCHLHFYVSLINQFL